MHVGRRRVPLTRRRGAVPSDLVRQCAPESWTVSVDRGLLERLYRKVVCFDVFSDFRGIHNRRHSMTPCPRMLPIRMGAASCGAASTTGTGAASREGQSSNPDGII